VASSLYPKLHCNQNANDKDPRQIIEKFMQLKYIAIIFVFFVSGCASNPVYWSAMGGSKSNGTVELSYVYRPVLDSTPESDEAALNIAINKCVAWSYIGAKAFGGSRRECNKYGVKGTDCVQWRMIKIYQCLEN
jgi:trehalose utilization protein